MQGNRVGAAEVRQEPSVEAGASYLVLNLGKGEGHGQGRVVRHLPLVGQMPVNISDKPSGQTDQWLPPVSIPCVLHTNEECSCTNF